jgi:hypothetical protein
MVDKNVLSLGEDPMTNVYSWSHWIGLRLLAWVGVQWNAWGPMEWMGGNWHGVGPSICIQALNFGHTTNIVLDPLALTEHL